MPYTNSSVYSATGPQGNTAYAGQGPQGNKAYALQGSQGNYAVKGPQGNIYYGSIANSQAGGCAGTQYGCCPDNVTAKNSDGSNCMPYTNSSLYTATGPQGNTAYAGQGPQGNIYYGSTANSQSGGCSGTQTSSSTSEPVPALQTGGCSGTQYGCCPDNITAKNSSGSNCSPYPPPPVQTNTVFIPPPQGVKTVENNSYETTAAPVDSSEKSCVSCPQPAPCPPCGRCPEPSFECKKVPNYASTNSEYLPMPVLSDFSQFGM
jgi:hypothetical protein